ncbi:MAG: thiamine pyrophosphate-binding protein [Chloroflexi bacterium]|nr:thiamine pyrophosphate-binding protein [Chloroflexota bacterium]
MVKAVATMARMRGAEALVRSLEKEGVPFVFGLPGHGNTNILDALYDSPIRFKLVRHEQAAAHIADGYARISGKVGVCCSSVGPGAANTLMGLGAAFAASSPVVAIFGGIIARLAGRGQLQETSRPETPTDHAYIQVVQPLVKKAWRIEHAELIPEVTRRAVQTALSGRPGPVAIEVPWDIQAEPEDVELQDPSRHRFGRRLRPDAEHLRVAAEKLRAARHPVILAGWGAVLSEASAEIVELANSLGCPVATTNQAKGIIREDHPLSIGMVGWLGHPVAHEYIREHADYVLVLGSPLSDLTTCWWTEGYPFVRENRFVQVDIEPAEIGKVYPVEVGLVGDVKATLAELNALVREEGERDGRAATLRLVAELKQGFRLELPPDAGRLEPLRVAAELRELLPRDSILAVDTGNHQHYFSAFYPIYGPRRLLNPGGWTPMGFGPTAVLGAKLAEPQTPCVCVTGDGGFQMVCQEVLTAVEWELPVVWIVFNNVSLQAIREGQKGSYGGRIIGTDFHQRADHAKMAEAFGAVGLRVETYRELGPAVGQALRCGRPCVVDLILERDAAPPPVAGRWCEPARDWAPPLPRGAAAEQRRN